MKSPLLTIVIVNYNSFNLLYKCLLTLSEKSHNLDFDVLVVDNNSTEGDVFDIIKKFKFVQLIRNNKNIGFAAANNMAVKQVSSEYLLLLNNDTALIENSLKIVIEFARKLKGNYIIGCKLLNIDRSHQNSAIKFPGLFRQFAATFYLDKIFFKSKPFNKKYLHLEKEKNPQEIDSVFGAFMFMPRETYNRLNGFDERFFFYYEDIDLCFRLNKLGGKVYYFPGTSVIHFGGGSTNKNLKFEVKNKMISRIQYAQKHFKGIYKFLFVLIEYFGLLFRIPSFFILGIITMDKRFINKSVYMLRLLFFYPRNLFK
ncbi:glycosyltransferase [Candidatus Woesearchaeota archaeon]|nr:glycosyltransferase [Candidatus Woesearchaeota archaeon]